MKKSDGCASGKQQATSVCRTVKDIETVHPFPSSGLLAENLGLPLPHAPMAQPAFGETQLHQK